MSATKAQRMNKKRFKNTQSQQNELYILSIQSSRCGSHVQLLLVYHRILSYYFFNLTIPEMSFHILSTPSLWNECNGHCLLHSLFLFYPSFSKRYTYIMEGHRQHFDMYFPRLLHLFRQLGCNALQLRTQCVLPSDYRETSSERNNDAEN